MPGPTGGGASDAARQKAGLGHTEHRPSPLPAGPWVLGQTWHHLLLAHWAVPPERLAGHLPAGVVLDTRDGEGWVGVVAFVVTATRLRGLPVPRRLGRFPEVNVRTYVTVANRPGIFFLSLDVPRASAVLASRAVYRLPYFRADMAVGYAGSAVRYESRRVAGPAPASLRVAYAPAGVADAPAPGTLEHFLTERYRLYTAGGRGRVLHADIHHPPWPLQPAAATFEEMTMTAPTGIEPAGEPLLHYARRIDTVFWPPRRTR